MTESPEQTLQSLHVQEQLDESLEETFPASDPPAAHLRDDPPANAPALWRTARRLENDAGQS
jgi:hypothetical protein